MSITQRLLLASLLVATTLLSGSSVGCTPSTVSGVDYNCSVFTCGEGTPCCGGYVCQQRQGDDRPFCYEN
jgi:hypothetical protein